MSQLCKVKVIVCTLDFISSLEGHSFNSGDILTLVRDGWLHHGTPNIFFTAKNFYFQCALQIRPFRPLIDMSAIELISFVGDIFLELEKNLFAPKHA